MTEQTLERAPLESVDVSDHDEPFCGPVALASIAGVSYNEAEAAIRAVRNAAHATGDRVLKCNLTEIEGVYEHELIAAFSLFEFQAQLAATCETGSRPTLANFLAERSRLQMQQTLLINLEPSYHFVAVCGQGFVDTYTAGEVVNICDAPHLRKAVGSIYTVKPNRSPLGWLLSNLRDLATEDVFEPCAA